MVALNLGVIGLAEPRENPLFAQCGLNCGLCPIFHIENQQNSCPGCGGGPGAQNCKLRRCAKEHGRVEYCYECFYFPCDKYREATEYDSFISHRNMVADQNRAKAMGIDAYQAELDAKMAALQTLLDGYNDGRRKSFFCTAVNLLPLEDIQSVMEQISQQVEHIDDIKARGKQAAALFQAKADELGISLKLNRNR